MDSDEIQVFYPTWMKVLGIIFLPIIDGVAIWLGLRPIWETDLTDAQVVLFPIMGIAVLYQCTIGFRCFKYFSTVLVIHDTGVDSYTKGKVEEYTWSDLEVKEYAFATTTQIKCKNRQVELDKEFPDLFKIYCVEDSPHLKENHPVCVIS